MRPSAVWAALLGVEKTVIEAVGFDGDEETLERFRVVEGSTGGSIEPMSAPTTQRGPSDEEDKVPEFAAGHTCCVGSDGRVGRHPVCPARWALPTVPVRLCSVTGTGCGHPLIDESCLGASAPGLDRRPLPRGPTRLVCRRARPVQGTLRARHSWR